MDLQGIATLIGSVGFPIVMCIFLFNYIKDTQDKLISAINNLTQMVARVNDKLDLDQRKEDHNAQL